MITTFFWKIVPKRRPIGGQNRDIFTKNVTDSWEITPHSCFPNTSRGIKNNFFLLNIEKRQVCRSVSFSLAGALFDNFMPPFSGKLGSGGLVRTLKNHVHEPFKNRPREIWICRHKKVPQGDKFYAPNLSQNHLGTFTLCSKLFSKWLPNYPKCF